MSVFLSPVFNDQQLDVNGDPLTGGQVFTYLAGSSTPAASYTSASGAVSQANPVILNSLGAPSNPIWLLAGLTYKMVLKDADGVTLRTIDNVAGVNDASVSVSEWVESGLVPTFLSATTFSVPGDQTGTLQTGRRIRSTNSGGTIYSSIVSAVFGSGVTTVTTLNDSGVLDAGLSAVAYGFVSSTNTSAPQNITGNAGTATNATTSANCSRSVLAGGLATGGGALTADRTVTVTASSQAQAEAGSDNTTAMTPLRTEQHMLANALGWGQTWQNVIGSRVAGTSYQNTTGKPIVWMYGHGQASTFRRVQVSVDDSTWVTLGLANDFADMTTIIPPTHYYRAEDGSGSSGTMGYWSELR